MNVCIAQNVSLSDHLALSTYLRSISKYLAKHEDINLILLPLKGTSIPDDISTNIEIHEIDGNLYSIKGNIQYSYNLYKKLNEINKEKPIDLVHCLYPNSSVFGAVFFKKRSPKTRIIYDVRSPWIDMSVERGSIPMYIAPIYRKIAYSTEVFLDRYVDEYIFITEGLKKLYQNKIKWNSKVISIIPSGVDLHSFSKKDPQIIRTKYGVRKDDFLLGYIGVISSTRELNFILRSLKELSSKNENYKLMFVGNGDDKENLEKISSELEIENKVIFTNKINYEYIPYFTSAFDAGICHLPNNLIFRYSFPLKILEYLACEIPVLASDIKAHRDILSETGNIYLYNDEMSFIHQIDKIENDNDKSNITNVDNYDWSVISQKIINQWHMNS